MLQIPLKKFASLCFIFPSFQQKILDMDLKDLGKNGTSDILSEPIVMGSVNSTSYPHLEEDT